MLESAVSPFWVSNLQQMLALLGQQADRLCVGFHRLLHRLVALYQLQGADLILDKQTRLTFLPCPPPCWDVCSYQAFVVSG